MNTMSAPRIVAGVLMLTAIYFSGTVLVPFTLALLISILLDPVVVRLHAYGIHRGIASFFAMIAFISVMVGAGAGVYSVCTQTLASSPAYLVQIKKLARLVNAQTASIQHQTGNLSPTPAPTEDIQKVQVVEGMESWFSMGLRVVGSVFEVFSLTLFVPLLVFYFLSDKSNLLESFNSISGRVIYLPKLHSELPKMIRAFVFGNLMGGLIMVVLNLVLFYFLDLKHPFGLAAVSGFLNLIPLFGAPLALIFPLAQALVQWTDPFSFAVLVIGLVTFHFVVGNVVLPQIIGPRINVNPAGLVTGLLFWGWMWGAMGFLLAIPLTATIKILLESNRNTAHLANLLAAKPRLVVVKAGH